MRRLLVALMSLGAVGAARGGPPCVPVQTEIVTAPVSSSGFSWHHGLSGATLISHDKVTYTGALHTFDRRGEDWVLVNSMLFPNATTAIDGDRAVAGIMSSTSPKLRILQRSGLGWAVQQELYPQPPGPHYQFAQTIAISGGTVIACSPHQLVGGLISAGAVHLYENTGGVWAFKQLLTAEPSGVGARFGWSLDADGPTVVVGAPAFDIAGLTAAGAAVIFERVGEQWTQTQHLRAPTPGAYRTFGVSVAVEGNTVIVGESPFDGYYPAYPGAAYVYVRNAGGWVLQAKLTASDAGPNDRFGNDVALESDTALIASRLHGTGAVWTAPGAAYLFRRAGSAWTEEAKLVGVNTLGYISFGVYLEMSGGHAMIAAHTPATQSALFAFRLDCPSCYPDCTGDGGVTVADFACFLARFDAGEMYADCNQDVSLTVADFGCFQTKFVTGCP